MHYSLTCPHLPQLDSIAKGGTYFNREMGRKSAKRYSEVLKYRVLPLIDPTSPIAPQNNIFHTKLNGNQVSDQIWFMHEGP